MRRGGGRVGPPAAALAIAAAAIRSAASGESPPERAVAATIKIFHPNNVGAGFFVAPPADLGPRAAALVTAAHCLEKMPADAPLMVLRRPSAGGALARWDVPLPIREKKRALWTRHPSQDVAAIVVDLPPEAAIRPLPFSAVARADRFQSVGARLGAAGWVLGFPTRMESDSAGLPVCRHASIASDPMSPSGTFLADFRTFVGDSGGPMILPDGSAGAPCVIGVVVAHFRHDEKINTLFDERTIHHPLDLSTVVRSDAICEVIEQACADRRARAAGATP